MASDYMPLNCTLSNGYNGKWIMFIFLTKKKERRKEGRKEGRNEERKKKKRKARGI